MYIENEIFKRSNIDFCKLKKYGFIKENNKYKYSKKFMNDSFKADIYIDKNGTVTGKVYDLDADEEYTNFRIEDATGEFVNTVKKEYINILKDIASKCFERQYFIFNQSNRITNMIKEKYDIGPEFLWDKFPNHGVFRNPRSGKWFGIIMDIDKSKIISNEEGEIEILNVKLDSDVEMYINKKGIYPAYHLSKKNWITIILDDTLSDEEILQLIEISYENSNIKGEWLVPANPKYYDIVNAFNNTDIIIWKQSNNIKNDDIVYIYVGEPYSAILFKCVAIETDIPYEYKDKNLSMSKIMKIKLLKRYKENEFTFSKLKELGVMAIRGPRSVTNKLSKELNK